MSTICIIANNDAGVFLPLASESAIASTKTLNMLKGVKLSSKYVNQNPSSKKPSLSCQSCERFTVIEGETICFLQGEIIRLQPMPTEHQNISFSCNGWKTK
ncbi:MAG: hypothetical protein ACI8SK_001119 [Shewanella sp.]|jgi:hypothetical protein